MTLDTDSTATYDTLLAEGARVLSARDCQDNATVFQRSDGSIWQAVNSRIPWHRDAELWSLPAHELVLRWLLDGRRAGFDVDPDTEALLAYVNHVQAVDEAYAVLGLAK